MRKFALLGFALLVIGILLFLRGIEEEDSQDRRAGISKSHPIPEHGVTPNPSRSAERERESIDARVRSFFAANRGEIAVIRIQGRAYDEVAAPLLRDFGLNRLRGNPTSPLAATSPLSADQLRELVEQALIASPASGASVFDDGSFNREGNEPVFKDAPEPFEWHLDADGFPLSASGRVLAREEARFDLSFQVGNAYRTLSSAISMKEGNGTIIGMNPDRELEEGHMIVSDAEGRGDKRLAPPEEPWALILYAGKESKGR